MVITWNDLRDARERIGFTQEELANELGVSTRTITNWEATGVPRKAEYKVERFFGENLHRSESPPATPGLFDDVVAQLDAQPVQLPVDTAPSRLELVRVLDQFPDYTILEYLTRRALRRRANEVSTLPTTQPDVGGSIEDVPVLSREEELALRKSDHDIAAFRGTNQADLPHAE